MFFLFICVFVGYPNIVATYGRGYTGFSPSYSYQFPGEFVCLSVCLSDLSICLIMKLQTAMYFSVISLVTCTRVKRVYDSVCVCVCVCVC